MAGRGRRHTMHGGRFRAVVAVSLAGADVEV